MSDNLVLSAENIAVGYGKNIIVDGLSFELCRGKVLTLIGPNGAGKSTVLKTITAQLPVISGKIALCGKNLGDMNEGDIAKRLSVLLTEKITAEKMTCGDIASTGRYPYTGKFGVLNDKDREIVKNAMQLTSVYGLYDRNFAKISDGQRQCVMLARAIAQEPEVMLLDEPTSFLDIGHKLQILSLLRRLAAERNIAVIQSLHELDLAQKFSDTVLCIRDGKADRIGTPEQIFKKDYIEGLYGIADGSYDVLYGTAEPHAVGGEPKVFVIGGGGAAIPVYRSLQRQNIPFAAGVLHKNDVEYPLAKTLAVCVAEEKAFEPVSQAVLTRAKDIMLRCQSVVCCVSEFGTMNSGNKELYELAAEKNLLKDTDDVL